MKTIFFDLDGTLTDPKIGITRSIQYALEGLGREVPHQDALTWCIGPPLHASFVKLLGDVHLADRAMLLYRERFGDVGMFENAVYAGIEPTLASLADGSRRLFVATSKPHVYATRIIAHFKLDAYFEHVFGSELDGTRVDKTELLKYAIETTGIDPADALMIGDRSHDIVGARNNSLRALGVLYGYGSRDELIEAGAHGLCGAPEEIPTQAVRSSR
jgi:phosphoglycolate phosphatase